jgi:hypothetical protein
MSIKTFSPSEGGNDGRCFSNGLVRVSDHAGATKEIVAAQAGEKAGAAAGG